MKVLVIVPAFNEDECIESVIKRLKSTLDHSYSILVIDDGSSDHTLDICRKCGVYVVSHPCNLGYGASLQTGYKYADINGFDIVVQIDADGQHNPEDIRSLIDMLRSSEADLVIGSRFIGQDSFSPGKLKGVAIGIFRRMIYLSTKIYISDPTSGLRAFKRSIFCYYSKSNRIPSDYPDADFIVDVLLKGWVIKEVGVGNQKRGSGVSMHSGLKPIVYFCKVFISMLVNVINGRLGTVRGHKAFE